MTFKADLEAALTAFGEKAAALAEIAYPYAGKHGKSDKNILIARLGDHTGSNPYGRGIYPLDKLINTPPYDPISNHQALRADILHKEITDLAHLIFALYSALPAFSHPAFKMEILVERPAKTGPRMNVTLDGLEFLDRPLVLRNLLARLTAMADHLSVFPRQWTPKEYVIWSSRIVAPTPELALIKYGAFFVPVFWEGGPDIHHCDVHEVHNGKLMKNRLTELRDAALSSSKETPLA